MPKQASALARWIFVAQKHGAATDAPTSHTMVRSFLSDIGAQKWVFQLERGAEAGRLHYQGAFQLGKKKRKTALIRAWTKLGLNAKWLTVQPAASLGAFEYSQKEDTRVDGPWADHPIYTGQDLKCMRTPFPWQREVMNQIEKKPDDRTINWVYNPAGNVGKSKLIKYLCFTKQAKAIGIGTATQLKTKICTAGPNRCYLLDMPRSRGKDERLEDIFSAIEEIKNGFVSTAMYGKDQELMFMPPHVWVFSNHPAPTEKMSGDRWVQWTVSKDQELELYHGNQEVVERF